LPSAREELFSNRRQGELPAEVEAHDEDDRHDQQGECDRAGLWAREPEPFAWLVEQSERRDDAEHRDHDPD